MLKKSFIILVTFSSIVLCCCAAEKIVVPKTPILNYPENYDASIVESNKGTTTSEIISVEEIKENNVCPNGMTHIVGEYCTNLVEKCLKWGDPKNPGVNGPVQCLAFDPPQCMDKEGQSIHMDYCIDTIMYPYDLESKPATNMTWYAAKKICEDQGKKLCGIKQFQQACRGPENNAYPTGNVRRCDLCNCDKVPWLDPKTHTFEELDKRVPLKDTLECKSGYGVSGLVGNTDRWVYNELYGEKPYKSALVGGHPILGARNRCNDAVTLAHYENSQYYEFGNPLCCSDVKEEK